MELAEAEQYAVASLFSLALSELQPYDDTGTPWGEPAGLEGDYGRAALAALGPEALEAWWGFDLVAPGGLLDSVLLRLGIPEQRWRGLRELPALVAAGGSSGGGTPALRTLVRSLVEVLDPGLASALPPLRPPAPAPRAEAAAEEFGAEPRGGAGGGPPSSSSPPSPGSPPPPRAVHDELFAGLLTDSEGDEDWEADLALHRRQVSVRRAASAAAAAAAAGSSPLSSRGASREVEVRELLGLASPALGSAGLAGLEERGEEEAPAAARELSSRGGSPGASSSVAAEEDAAGPPCCQQQERAAGAGGGSCEEAPLSVRAVAALWELVRCCVGAAPPPSPHEGSGDGTEAVRIPAVQWYDARARVALRLVATWLQVPWRKVAALELLLGSDRDAAAAAAGGAAAAAAAPGDESSRRLRYLRVGAAALGGGALFALTGGLAAPAIAAGLGSVLSIVPGTAAVAGGVSGFLATSGGVAVTAGTMATAGAASTGSKMAYRTAEISEFGFLEVAAGEHAEGRARRGKGASGGSGGSGGDGGGAKAAAEGSPGKSGEVAEGGEPGPHHPAGLWGRWFGGKAGEDAGKKEAPLLPALQRSRSDADARLSVFLGVSGWVTAAPEDYARPWAGVAPPDAEAYALAWESRELLGLSRALGALLVQQAAGQGASFAVRHFFYAGAGLVAALGPTLLLGTAAGLLIENAWAVAMERAAKAGKLLARVLLAGGAGGRPVTLVGHGLGARLIWFTLLELARQGARGVVQDCCLLGAPVTIAPVRWSLARAAVAGRLVNGYCRSDAVLGVCYGGSTGWMRAAAGLAPVEGVAGVENADLSRLVDGHLGYLEALPEVLDCLGLSN